jgi:hypothetical protein
MSNVKDENEIPKSVWIVIAVVLLVSAALAGALAPADIRLLLAAIVMGMLKRSRLHRRRRRRTMIAMRFGCA